jgi:hypothetical protein
MKILSSSEELEQSSPRAVGIGRRIGWAVYLLGALSVLVLWFITSSGMLSYFFSGWIMVGALLLWLTEDIAD